MGGGLGLLLVGVLGVIIIMSRGLVVRGCCRVVVLEVSGWLLVRGCLGWVDGCLGDAVWIVRMLSCCGGIEGELCNYRKAVEFDGVVMK